MEEDEGVSEWTKFGDKCPNVDDVIEYRCPGKITGTVGRITSIAALNQMANLDAIHQHFDIQPGWYVMGDLSKYGFIMKPDYEWRTIP